jgi:hypothetical protein
MSMPKAPRQLPRARFPGKVVGAHDQAGEAGFHVVPGGGDRGRVDDAEKRLDHRPQPDLVVGRDVDQARCDVKRSAGFDTFGTRIACGRALAAALRKAREMSETFTAAVEHRAPSTDRRRTQMKSIQLFLAMP